MSKLTKGSVESKPCDCTCSKVLTIGLSFYMQVWERMKLVIEPAAACAVAAVLSEQFRELAKPAEVKRVGVILCGGNVDLNNLPWTT